MSTELALPLHRFHPDRPPVVLLGGTNLVRALGLAGIAVIVASPNPREPAFGSRYCVAHRVLPPFEDGQAAVDALVTMGDRLSVTFGRRAPLMYGSDDALELLYAHRERLQRYFLLLLNDHSVGTALLDKDRFQALAQERGFPVPRMLAWEGDGPGTLRGTPVPVLVKPRLKLDWHGSPLCERLFNGDGKALIFESGGAAADDPTVALFREQLLFQEYIDGGDGNLWSYHGFADEAGTVLASFTGRKLRTYPPLTGESAFIELAHDEALAALGAEIAARCPLKGAFKMDFKRATSDGRWYLLEINARFNLWHYLGAVNGVNLMQVAYEYLVDRKRPVRARARGTYRWLSLALDFKAYRKLSARRELSLARWIASILAGRKVYNIFAWRDPGPLWRYWASRFAGLCSRRSSRVLARVRQWRSTAF